MTVRQVSPQNPARDPIPLPARVALCALIGAVAAVVGTGAHRMGASMNIPYGLLLAFALIAMSTILARALVGATGLAVHLIVASLIVWKMSGYGPAGDILMPTGGSALVTFFSLRASVIWELGAIVIQTAILCLPSRLFDGLKPGSVKVPARASKKEERA